MKHTLIVTATLSALLALGTAQAQTTMDPSMAASGPATRAEVKAATRAAMKDGSIASGDAGATKARPQGGPAVKKDATMGKTRAEVKGETRSAMKDGSLSQGDANYSNGGTEGRPQVKADKTAGKTRAEVKAETKAALAKREIPVTERQVPLPSDTKTQ